MFFTPAERRLLALIAILLGAGYLLSALCHLGLLSSLLCPSGDRWPVASEAPASSDWDPITAGGAPRAAPPPDSGSGVVPAAPVAGSSPAADAATPFVGGYLDLNRADSSALCALPGIGPALAGRILARRRSGRFDCLEELLEIKGIGPRRLEPLRDLLIVLPLAPQPTSEPEADSLLTHSRGCELHDS